MLLLWQLFCHENYYNLSTSLMQLLQHPCKKMLVLIHLRRVEKWRKPLRAP